MLVIYLYFKYALKGHSFLTFFDSRKNRCEHESLHSKKSVHKKQLEIAFTGILRIILQ